MLKEDMIEEFGLLIFGIKHHLPAPRIVTDRQMEVGHTISNEVCGIFFP